MVEAGWHVWRSSPIPPLIAESTRADCSEPCLIRWTGMERPQPLWATCHSVQSSLQQKCFFSYIKVMSSIAIYVHCLLPCHWLPLRKACLHHFCVCVCVSPHLFIHINKTLHQSEEYHPLLICQTLQSNHLNGSSLDLLKYVHVSLRQIT